ncbi:MAG: ATP-dependent Clp protease proteolytic subunit, partial [Catenulispora sp.]|nr:ATP-dependent Clp protease proteolytic subunit [Catenulispora sp.]
MTTPLTPTARAGVDSPLGLSDQVYNRLLRNRIIFLGT